MKKIINSVQMKIIATFIAVIIQLLVITVVYLFLGNNFTWFYIAMLILSLLAVSYIATRDSKVEYKMIWMLTIVVFPILGGLLYIMFWRNLFSEKELKHYKEIGKIYAEAMIGDEKEKAFLLAESKSAHRQSQYISNSSDASLYQNTEVEYYSLGENMFCSMLKELEKAEKFIFFEYFIIQEGKMWGSILSILEAKAKLGVDVRVMYDDFGCLATLKSDFTATLRKKGIACVAFNKFNHIFNSNFNSRNHRKICVIDGNVGFTGGINIADEYINVYPKHGHWKDTAVLLRGAAVYGLTTMFLSIWNSITHTTDVYENFKPITSVISDDFVQPFTDTPIDDEPVGERLYMSILNSATDYVYITTPYLIISSDMMSALQIAAKSGIDVRIILPGIADRGFVHFLSRSYYEPLINSGVKIYEYTPGFIHSKMFLSDDETAVVGTINLDYRSLSLHYECGVWIYNSKVIFDIKKDYINTLDKCKEITQDNMQIKDNLGFFKFVSLSVLRLLAPLL